MPKQQNQQQNQLTLDQINPELLNTKILIALLKACQELEHIFTIRAKELAFDNTELNIALQNLNQIITFKEKLVNLIERTQAVQNLQQSKLKPINEDTKIALEILQYIQDTYQINPKNLLIYILHKLDLETIKHEIQLTNPLPTSQLIKQ
jgi:adenylate cyclase